MYVYVRVCVFVFFFVCICVCVLCVGGGAYVCMYVHVCVCMQQLNIANQRRTDLYFKYKLRGESRTRFSDWALAKHEKRARDRN